MNGLLKFLYNVFVTIYPLALKLLSFWNPKARLWLRGRKGEFPGWKNTSYDIKQPTVWMHCASLGEFEQGRPLLESIRKQFPKTRIALSFFSSSGYEAAKNYSGADLVFYLPMDSRKNADQLLDRLNPDLVLWVKYEYWFYYLDSIHNRKIPLMLVSGIFLESQPFFQWYGRLWRQMLTYFSYFFLQTEASRDLLKSIGITEGVYVTGDTRFDRVIAIAGQFEPNSIIERFIGNHPVIVAGSTWEDDEAELVHYVKANPGIRFIIAPHETDALNIQDVKDEFRGSVLYSELINNPGTELQPHNNCLIIDNVGMLSRLYKYADIAYVGGGFGKDGVHNVLEPAVYGKPVFYGPEFEKFAEAIGLVECGGGIPINNALELEEELNALWNDREKLKLAGDAARSYVLNHAGATGKVIRLIHENRLLIN